MTSAGTRGPLEGLRVIELCDEKAHWCGKLMADAGADVIKVEPPTGDLSRSYEPFYQDKPDANGSLYFWYYNTSKRGMTLDLEHPRGRELLKQLIVGADVFVETERPGSLASMGLDYDALEPLNENLIHVSITPFGRTGPRSQDEATDLSILAAGGPVWSCGYDDHTIPPVRGGGNQGYNTASHYAFMAALVALLNRDHTGAGQFIDVNMHAAANVTTELATVYHAVSGDTVQRQTGRHAMVEPTMDTQVLCADGNYVNGGVPARRPEQFRALHEWLTETGLIEEFLEAPLIEIAMEREQFDLGRLAEDEEMQALFGAARSAATLLASRLSAFEFFKGAQERDFQVGAILWPEEAMENEHYDARGFYAEVEHPELGQSFRYPGAPYKMLGSPVRVSRRAPLLGEHNSAILAELGLSENEIADLKSERVI